MLILWTGSGAFPGSGGLFAVFFLSLSACMVVSALDIRSLTGIVLVPLMMLSFPSVCSMFTFMFTSGLLCGGHFSCLYGCLADPPLSVRLPAGDCASGAEPRAVSSLSVPGAGGAGLRPVPGSFAGGWMRRCKGTAGESGNGPGGKRTRGRAARPEEPAWFFCPA